MSYLDRRVSMQKDPATKASEFQGDMPRRVYKAVPEKFWINGDSDVNGNFIDIRQEVDLFAE